MDALLIIHSILRYVLLILLISAVINAFRGWLGGKEYTPKDRRINILTAISSHLQLLIGLVLYFISPVVDTAHKNMGQAMKNPELRFWAVEHITLMVVAIVLITIGRISTKRTESALARHKRIAWFFLAGLILILVGIPWPFSAVSRPWF